ncbi:MAG TPA: aromatic amino acid lyase, partial [Chroococcales cyanobacterium]
MTSVRSHSQKTATDPLLVDGHSLTLEDVERVALRDCAVRLSPAALKQLGNSRAVVERLLDKREVVYGITTGFGKFKDVYIAPEDSRTLQRNFLRSHAAGTGTSFDVPTVRAIMLLRANALAKGFSGIRTEVVELLLALLNNGITPS